MKAAKAEFLENDFEKASIRKIAVKADTSKSNIYNYFKNKDDLFCTVLKPTMDTINYAIAAKHKEYAGGAEQSYSFDNQKKIIEVIMTFVFKNKDDFVLLLFKSKGSSYETFKEKIKKLYTGIMMNWLALSAPQKEVSYFFVESVADFYINTISNLIVKDVTHKDVEKYFSEFLSFVYGGWQNILGNGGENEK